MAAHPMDSGSVPEWNTPGHVYVRNQQIALLRAGVIALVLLGILAAIVLI